MVYHKPRKSCLDCRRRHLKCRVLEGSSFCVWCTEHGLECRKDLETGEAILQAQPAKDGSYLLFTLGGCSSCSFVLLMGSDVVSRAIILNGSTSAFGGFQLSKSSFLPPDGPSAERILRLRQELGLQHQSSTAWTEEQDLDHELRLDKPIMTYLHQLYFARVHPYVPIITQTYLDSVAPSQLLLSAMYGVAARLPGAIVSTRDFQHIKRVFEHQLKCHVSNYSATLQTCQALALIHLTLEMQCEGLEGVEVWPLRLSAAVRMAFELNLHREETYPRDSHLAELHRRLFWTLFTKDRWTSTGKGYPLMIDIADTSVSLPAPHDLDTPTNPPHEFFIELIHQALVLGSIHLVCFRPDRYKHVTPLHFQQVERSLEALGARIHNPNNKLSPESKAHLVLNYTAITLLFYGPIFKPTSEAESALFSLFLPSPSTTRLRLANDAVAALGYASRELLYSGPAIWSILFYATVRCFLVALSIKHDPIGGYIPALCEAATDAVARVADIAKFMCEERRWCFMVLSGTLVLFARRVAEDRDAVKKEEPVNKRRKRKAPEAAPTTVGAEEEGPPVMPVEECLEWDLGKEYSQDIDWSEWDILFPRVAG